MSPPFHQDFLRVPDGASLYYEVHGKDAPGIVLCDGLGCDGFAWKYLLPFLQRDHRTVRWHYRGHGRSSLPEDPRKIGVEYTCDDLARIMDASGLKKALLFGHSMGVQVALEFQRLYPERVLGLVMICGSYGHPLDTFHDTNLLRKAFPFIRKVVERFPRPFSRFFRYYFSTELAMQMALTFELNRALLSRLDMLPYFAHLANMDPVVFVRTLDSLAVHSAWEHLPQVRVPTLVIGGGKDRFTPGWLSERMAEAIPGAEFLLIPSGTHTAPLEHPQLVELRVQYFLETHFSKPAPKKARRSRQALRPA